MPTYSHQWKIDEETKQINILAFEDAVLMGSISLSPSDFNTVEKIEVEARKYTNNVRESRLVQRAIEVAEADREARVGEIITVLRASQPARPTSI